MLGVSPQQQLQRQALAAAAQVQSPHTCARVPISPATLRLAGVVHQAMGWSLSLSNLPGRLSVSVQAAAAQAAANQASQPAQPLHPVAEAARAAAAAATAAAAKQAQVQAAGMMAMANAMQATNPAMAAAQMAAAQQVRTRL
jgi:hypothetical protein